MSPDVTVFVHPINTTDHATLAGGFRWAVQIGGTHPSNIGACANAGWAPSKGEAWLAGETAGATACRALRVCGLLSEYRLVELDDDPIPPNEDRLHLL